MTALGTELLDAVEPLAVGATATAPTRPRTRLIGAALDIAAILLIVLGFGPTAAWTDDVFHGVFALLIIRGFMFGLTGTLIRIAAVGVVIAVGAQSAWFGSRVAVIDLTEMALMLVTAVAVAFVADARRQTSRRYARLFRQASDRLLTVQEMDRQRFARDLHDGIGQLVTAITFGLDEAADEPTAAQMRARVLATRTLAGYALAETRDLAHRIRPARIGERGLLASIGDLASESGFRVTVAASAGAAAAHRLSPAATVEAYRVVQEALSNAARHSGAPAAEVLITAEGDALVIDVADGGIGFDAGAVAGSGIGLAGMHERAELMGGHLAVRAAPGSGTRVRLRVPLPAAVPLSAAAPLPAAEGDR